MSKSAHNADANAAALFRGPAWWHELLHVELALVEAQARAGAVPADAAQSIATAAVTFQIDEAALAASEATHGFPVLGLVAQLKQHVGEPAARWVHWGGTTQDILDNALVCQLSRGLDTCDRRLASLVLAFADLAHDHRETYCLGRTHLQAALPTSYALKAGNWLAPLRRHQTRLPALRQRLHSVQCGGAAGTLAAWGEHGPAIIREFAAALNLAPSPLPWHTQRDALFETADWLVLIAQSLCKFGQDLLLLSQSDIAEVDVSVGAAGGSSAMPQKCNPIRCEALLQSARRVIHERNALSLYPPPEHERGTATTVAELTHLPLILAATIDALDTALTLATGLRIDVARARVNLDATRGLVWAEAATLALSKHLPPTAARALVKAAIADVGTGEGDLISLLRERTDAPIDWDRLTDPAAHLAPAHRQLDAMLASLDSAPHA
ncbi:lyase family protein [Actomonas aquatica]|uniref:Lyase family protein n=1 Tax=Actomonas aquatica TaxID=2866162 RepID=A0ABZ1C8U8_9BACT|nr:lyase family protein [Opitutus sp. WL0086]WRQ87886.1 lyase family protein [Opitutus sp. WL0086]